MTCARHFDRVPSRSVLGGCLTVSSCHAYQKYLKAPCILADWAQGCDIVSLVVCLGDRSEGFPRTQLVALSVRSGRGPVSGGAFFFLSFLFFSFLFFSFLFFSFLFFSFLFFSFLFFSFLFFSFLFFSFLFFSFLFFSFLFFHPESCLKSRFS